VLFISITPYALAVKKSRKLAARLGRICDQHGEPSGK
jgi:hypothetical protein